jgi:hypothetical protein
MEARSAYLDWLAAQLATEAPGIRRAAGEFGPDLVMGFATGFDRAALAPFVRSLRAVHGGRVGLYVDPCRQDVDAFLHENGVDRLTPPSQTSWRPHPTTERFGAYLSGLKAYPSARNVLLIDVRDVVFQGPPMEAPVAPLELYPESGEDRLAEDFKNLRWLRRMFSRKVADQLSERACLCAGAILGHRAEIERLCRILLFLSAIPRSGVGGAFGADQAALNLAAYMGLVDGAIFPNFGRVATVQRTASCRLRLDGWKVMNPDGSISPILHKYDRHSTIEEVVRRHWAPEMRREEHGGGIDLPHFMAHASRGFAKRLPEIR